MNPLAIIRDTLREQGRSQVWLAARIGVSESMLSKYLCGSVPTPDWAIERARVALGIPHSAMDCASSAPLAVVKTLSGVGQ